MVFLEGGVLSPAENRWFWRKNGENWQFTFYPQKQGVVLLKPRKPTKMTKVPQTKPPFAKNTVFATPMTGKLMNSILLQLQVGDVNYHNISNTELWQWQGEHSWGISLHQNYISEILLEEMNFKW